MVHRPNGSDGVDAGDHKPDPMSGLHEKRRNQDSLC